MSDSVLREAWQRWCFLAVGHTFEAEQHLIEVAPSSRLCPPGFVGVVTIGDRVIVTVPASEFLHPARRLVASTSTMDIVKTEAWQELAPDVVLGPARLAYAHPGSATDPDLTVEAIAHSSPEVSTLLASVPEDEAEESGVEGITSPVFVERDVHGDILAAAGWVEWPSQTAHVCILVATLARGQGVASRLGRAAVNHAATAGRLVQWRARPGPSVSVARRIGLTDVGAQLSLRPNRS